MPDIFTVLEQMAGRAPSQATTAEQETGELVKPLRLNMERIANATNPYEHFTYGFELETQATEGITESSLADHHHDAMEGREFDEEAYEEALASKIASLDVEDAKEYFREAEINEALLSMSLNLPERLWLVIQSGISNSIKGRDAAVSLILSQPELPDCIDIDRAKRLKANETIDKENYYNERYYDSDWDWLASKTSALTEAVDDCSIDGFEWRTNGGLDLPTFTEAAKEVFALEHDIDERCSFHIHCKGNDIRSAYGERFQLSLYEYLLDNIDRVPDSVLRRWRYSEDAGDECRDCGTAYENCGCEPAEWAHFFPPSLTPGKYSFVHRHDQGTWEFRCFGNVHNTEDAVTCAKLAAEAMQYAYQIRLGQREPLVAVDQWSKSKAFKCITQNIKLSEYLNPTQQQAQGE